MKNDSLELLVQKSIARSIAALEDTRDLMDTATLKKCIDLFENAESITFFGVGASLLVAKDAYLKFVRINKKCQVYEDQDIQMVLATNMKKEDLAVIISYSVNTPGNC